MRRSFTRKFGVLFLMHFLPPVALLAGISIWLYLSEVKSNLLLVEESETLQLDQGRYVFESHLKNAIQDLMYIASSENVSLVASDPQSDRYGEILARDFKALIENKGNYDQLRYIDFSGMELVRVNLRNDMGVIVAKPELQDKAGRYYFIETMQKGPGEVFISPIDLNMEHGVIESPLKPMVRLAMPVYDESNNKKGMVIINYLAERLIASLGKAGTVTSTRSLLLNSDGYWLKGESHEDEWGFMFPSRHENKMNSRYPQAWRQIAGGGSGQFRDEYGLFTYDTVTADRLLADMYHESGASIGKENGRTIRWKLVRFIPDSELKEPENALAKRYLGVNAILLSVWAIAAFSLSRARLYGIEASEQIHEREKRISEIVNSAFDAIITINERGVIETFNPAACRMFDYQESEVVGQKVNILMASPDREYHDLHIQNYMETGEGKFIGKPGRVTGMRNDGTAIDIEICIGAKQVSDHWLFTAICRRYHGGEESKGLTIT